MTEEKVPMTKLQSEIMHEFYAVSKTKVIYNKKERDELWKKAKERSSDFDFLLLKSKCPALCHQIQKSYDDGRNIQSAVFSECVYAQTYANMMGLNLFVNCHEVENFIPKLVKSLINSYYLVPRYVYSTNDKKRMLIQAGGCNGIDSALITVIDLVIYTIEFKEPGSKISEPDLPKYKEDGKLRVDEKWLQKYPQFRKMLEEQKDLNFFEVMGSNINNFSKESIDIAVSNNYSNKKKYADVICTEDIDGYLVMMPQNQVSTWASIEGEIRPAGRNDYEVWTTIALKRFLIDKGANIKENEVTIKMSNLTERRARGSNRKVSGYKLNPLFFIRANDCIVNVNGDSLSFNIKKMRQLNPTISGKMFFKKLKYDDVQKYYGF